MTNPLQPRPDDSLEDGAEEKPAGDEGSALTFDKVLKRQDLETSAPLDAQKAERAEKTARDVQSFMRRDLQQHGISRPGFGSQFGIPQFALRKSDFKFEIERPAAEVKPLVDDFLKKTPLRDDPTLSPAEKTELTQTRDSLSRFDTAAEALNDALHLARLYQHLRYIEEAKKATDLSLGIDPENHAGRELFKELERVHPADIGITRAAQAPFGRGSLSKSNLRARIANLAGGRVIVVGDLLIDELLEGKPERISREAPVLILEHVDTELIPGGAANTANNIAALQGKCHAIGVCGKDEYADKLAQLFDRAGIKHSLVADQSRPTTVKTRILSKAHALRQQLLRLDRISHEPIDALVEALIIDRIKAAAPDNRAIILSDYRGGAITDGVIRACRAEAARHNLMLIVDAQDNIGRFQDVTLITPNQPDTEQMVGYPIADAESLRKAGEDLLLITGAKAILVTRGPHGMALFEKGHDMIELPVFNRSEVFDVTGAGDTVVATMALALTTGCDFVEAMALGNLAAGIVVKKPGTAVTTPDEMLQALESVSLPE